MLSDARDLAVVENDDAVSVLKGSRALGYDEYGRRVGHFTKCTAKCGVGRIVQRRRAVVQNENFGLADKSAGDGQALTLTARKVFAVLQNSVFVRARVLDLLRILDNPATYTIDDDVMQLIKPHIGFKGTFIRYDIACEFGKIINDNAEKLVQILEKLNVMVPVNMLMWSGLNTFVRNAHPEMSPIYMDETNYMTITTVAPRNNAAKFDTLVNKFDAIVAAALAAAPAGQE